MVICLNFLIFQVYHTLAQSRSINTKQTLAYSLHEVARILGEGKLVEEELIPVFEEMIQVIVFQMCSAAFQMHQFICI
jgi:hypothetical protein